MSAEPTGMRRVMVGLVMTVAWVAVFVGVWRNTGTTDRPCNDVVTVPMTVAACVMPGPSVFPALPLATVAAAAVGVGLSRATRHGSPSADPHPPPAVSAP